MAVSILHRATGSALAVAGGIAFVWWLVAAATSADAYASFIACAKSPLGYLVAIGLTWSFFQHLFSGLRHFVLDIGAGYELKRNKFWAMMVLAGGIGLTGIVWTLIFLRNFA